MSDFRSTPQRAVKDAVKSRSNKKKKKAKEGNEKKSKTKANALVEAIARKLYSGKQAEKTNSTPLVSAGNGIAENDCVTVKKMRQDQGIVDKNDDSDVREHKTMNKDVKSMIKRNTTEGGAGKCRTPAAKMKKMERSVVATKKQLGAITKQKLNAATKIQALVRAGMVRMDYRIAYLQHMLNVVDVRRQAEISTIEANTEDEKNTFQRALQFVQEEDRQAREKEEMLAKKQREENIQNLKKSNKELQEQLERLRSQCADIRKANMQLEKKRGKVRPSENEEKQKLSKELLQLEKSITELHEEDQQNLKRHQSNQKVRILYQHYSISIVYQVKEKCEDKVLVEHVVSLALRCEDQVQVLRARIQQQVMMVQQGQIPFHTINVHPMAIGNGYDDVSSISNSRNTEEPEVYIYLDAFDDVSTLSQSIHTQGPWLMPPMIADADAVPSQDAPENQVSSSSKNQEEKQDFKNKQHEVQPQAESSEEVDDALQKVGGQNSKVVPKKRIKKVKPTSPPNHNQSTEFSGPQNSEKNSSRINNEVSTEVPTSGNKQDELSVYDWNKHTLEISSELRNKWKTQAPLITYEDCVLTKKEETEREEQPVDTSVKKVVEAPLHKSGETSKKIVPKKKKIGSPTKISPQGNSNGVTKAKSKVAAVADKRSKINVKAKAAAMKKTSKKEDNNHDAITAETIVGRAELAITSSPNSKDANTAEAVVGPIAGKRSGKKPKNTKRETNGDRDGNTADAIAELAITSSPNSKDANTAEAVVGPIAGKRSGKKTKNTKRETNNDLDANTSDAIVITSSPNSRDANTAEAVVSPIAGKRSGKKPKITKRETNIDRDAKTSDAIVVPRKPTTPTVKTPTKTGKKVADPIVSGSSKEKVKSKDSNKKFDAKKANVHDDATAETMEVPIATERPDTTAKNEAATAQKAMVERKMSSTIPTSTKDRPKDTYHFYGYDWKSNCYKLLEPPKLLEPSFGYDWKKKCYTTVYQEVEVPPSAFQQQRKLDPQSDGETPTSRQQQKLEPPSLLQSHPQRNLNLPQYFQPITPPLEHQKETHPQPNLNPPYYQIASQQERKLNCQPKSQLHPQSHRNMNQQYYQTIAPRQQRKLEPQSHQNLNLQYHQHRRANDQYWNWYWNWKPYSDLNRNHSPYDNAGGHWSYYGPGVYGPGVYEYSYANNRIYPYWDYHFQANGRHYRSTNGAYRSFYGPCSSNPQAQRVQREYSNKNASSGREQNHDTAKVLKNQYRENRYEEKNSRSTARAGNSKNKETEEKHYSTAIDSSIRSAQNKPRHEGRNSSTKDKVRRTNQEGINGKRERKAGKYKRNAINQCVIS